MNEDGKFQSDKYPTCPAGKVPLSTKDLMAQDILWIYAQRRRVIDEQFSYDLEMCLMEDGFQSPFVAPEDLEMCHTCDSLARTACIVDGECDGCRLGNGHQ